MTLLSTQHEGSSKLNLTKLISLKTFIQDVTCPLPFLRNPLVGFLLTLLWLAVLLGVVFGLRLGICDTRMPMADFCLVAVETCCFGWPSNVELRISFGVSVLSLSIYTFLSLLAGNFFASSTFFHRLAILLSTSLVLEDGMEFTLDVLPCLEPRARIMVFPLSLLCKLWFEAEFFIVGSELRFVDLLGFGLVVLAVGGRERLNCGSRDGEVLGPALVGEEAVPTPAVGFLSGTGRSFAGTQLSSLVKVPCLTRGIGLPATGTV